MRQKEVSDEQQVLEIKYLEGQGYETAMQN